MTSSPEALAVRYLSEHGFEATTAGQLADAMGMSRSTFFRRYGSKEGVIFADHDTARMRLEQVLSDPELSPQAAITRAPIEVFHSLVRDGDTARLRWELLRKHPSLRDHELVLTHRYERDFAEFLSRHAAPGTPAWASIALAAGLVAVHNAALRHWLRHADARAVGALERDLRDLSARFAPWFGGGEAPEAASRVVVAAFDAGASAGEVLRAVAAQLASD